MITRPAEHLMPLEGSIGLRFHGPQPDLAGTFQLGLAVGAVSAGQVSCACPADDRPGSGERAGVLSEGGTSACRTLLPQGLGDGGQTEPFRHGCVVPSGHCDLVGDGTAGGVEGTDDSGRLLVAHGEDGVGRLDGRQQAGSHLLGLDLVVACTYCDGHVSPIEFGGFGRVAVSR